MANYETVNGQLRLNETQEQHPGEKLVNKYLYIFIALFLGDFGIHQFYAGKKLKGFLYLLFCWTFIPYIFTIFDLIKACGRMKDRDDRIWI